MESLKRAGKAALLVLPALAIGAFFPVTYESLYHFWPALLTLLVFATICAFLGWAAIAVMRKDLE